MNLPKGYLSISQIKLYLQCPWKYKLKYIDGIKEPTTGPQIEGIVWGLTMEDICKDFLKTKKWAPLRVANIVWQKHWNEEAIKVSQWQGTQPDEAAQRAKRFLRELYVGQSPRLHPAMYDGKPGVELETNCSIGGIPFKVIPDLIEQDEEGFRLLDFKISNPDYQDVNRSIQLTIEAAVFEIERVSLLIGDKREGSLVWMNGTRDVAKALEYSEFLVTRVAEGISRGSFPLTNPEKNTLCSKKWCPHWKGCMGKYGF